MARRAFIHQVEARERAGRWFPALAGLLTISLLASTWVGLFTFLGANAAYGTASDIEKEFIPDVDSMDLVFPDLSRVSRVYASGGEQMAVLHDGRVSEPVPFDEIPQLVVNAVLAAEDKDFYQHEGVDFPAIAQAAIENVLFDRLRGGSTITQQVVKKTFVGDDVTARRKIAEAFVSAEVERRFSKDQILEFYLNSVYFGSGAYGIKAAAQEFFGKELDDLSAFEAATLAVLVRNPSLYDPRRNPAEVLDRRNQVIDQMAESGWITDRLAVRIKQQRLGVIDHTGFPTEAEHVVAEIKRQLLDLNNHQFDFLGTTKEERKRAIFGCPADDLTCTGGGGLRIESTIDLRLQREAFSVLQEWLPYPDEAGNLALCQTLAGPLALETEAQINAYAAANSCAPTGAIATTDTFSGAVIVMASGLPFDVDQFDLAVQGRRNPGSAFKPFTAVAALESGDITLGSFYNGSSPQTLECPYVCSSKGNVWTVANAGASYGVISLEEATSSSVNTVYAQVALEVGPERIVETANRMGIQSELRAVPSITLGTSEVSPLEMASAFSNFATNGSWAPTYLVSRILAADGSLLFEHQIDHQQVGDPRIFASVRRPLTKVPTGAGTAPNANIGRPQAGKTGTHQDYKDAWFVGFVPQYSTAVWVGYEADQIPLTDVIIHGEHFARVFGGSVPAPIWAQFMNIVLDGVEPLDFPAPAENLDEFFKTPTTVVPSVVGLPVDEAESAIRKAKLQPNVVEVASIETAGVVVSQTPEGGATVNQGQAVTIGVSTGIAPTGILPSVVGMTVEQALAALALFDEEAGLRLVIQTVNVPVDKPENVGKVMAMDPPGGSEVGYGAVITLSVGQQAAPPG